MINRIKSLLFVIFIMMVFTTQAHSEEVTERSKEPGRPVSRAPVAQHISNVPVVQHVSNAPATQRVSNVHNKQASPRVESMRVPQAIHSVVPQTHVAQPVHQRMITPRVYAVVSPSPVENRNFLHRQHHKYWHPRYNFYEHEYHFYPYVNVVSTVELSPDSIQVLFNGQTYYYDHWVFYIQEAGGYLAVPPPIGIIVSSVSPRATQAIINGHVYYNHNDVYYQPIPQGYQVVEPLK